MFNAGAGFILLIVSILFIKALNALFASDVSSVIFGFCPELNNDGSVLLKTPFFFVLFGSAINLLGSKLISAIFNNESARASTPLEAVIELGPISGISLLYISMNSFALSFGNWPNLFMVSTRN